MDRGEKENKIRILIAEDEKNIGDLLLELLEQEGREVVLVQNGLEAIDKLRKGPFDILITDLMMPEVDGMEVLHEAKKLHPQIMAIIITGYASLETAIQAVKEGAYDYLRKPFRLEELKISVDNACEKIRLQRENERLLEYVKKVKLEGIPKGAEGSFRPDSDSMEEPGGLGQNQKALFGPEWFTPYFFQDGQNKIDREKVISEIERLAKLRAQGVITNDEFELLKKKLFENIL